MKVLEHLDKATSPLISFEIVPPRRDEKEETIEDVIEVLDQLVKFDPPFIDVTSHAAKVVYEENDVGYEKFMVRPRVGTMALSAVIKHKYGVDAIPHVLCRGFTQEETEDFLLEMSYASINEIMCLRGDPLGYKKSYQPGTKRNRFASDLVDQVSRINAGERIKSRRVAKKMNFSCGVAWYPQKHEESPNLRTDLGYLKRKLDAGADYAVGQICFDNDVYVGAVAQARELGISKPLIPGVKIITQKSHLRTLPRTFGCTIPYDLSEEIYSAGAKHVPEIGMRFAREQIENFANHGFPAIHIYVMADASYVAKVMENLGSDKPINT